MTMLQGNALTGRIIGFAIDVHRQLGPGLLESAYEECLCFELKQSGELIIEIKTVERLMPIHEAQALTYLRLSGCKIGLLMNFNSLVLKDGLRRFML
jgi:hypothetical protein